MVCEGRVPGLVTLSGQVPGRSHYSRAYLGQDLVRFCSYREQVRFALRSDPRNVLVVGKGDGIVQDLLQRSSVHVRTLDIQSEFEPIVVGSVRNSPEQRGSDWSSASLIFVGLYHCDCIL